MAKKQTRPQTEIDAPKSVPIVSVTHRGPNRAERRHRVIRGPQNKIFALGKRRKTIPSPVRVPAINRPTRKAKRNG